MYESGVPGFVFLASYHMALAPALSPSSLGPAGEPPAPKKKVKRAAAPPSLAPLRGAKASCSCMKIRSERLVGVS
jgi:hypothetical protein